MHLRKLRVDPAPLMLLIAYCLLELLWHVLRGPVLPVSIFFVGASFVGAIGVAWGILVLLEETRVHDSIMVGIVTAVLVGKYWVVAGSNLSPWFVAPVVIPFILIGIVSLLPVYPRVEKTTWKACLLITLMMSTDTIKVLWLWTRGAGWTSRVYLGLTLTLALGLWVLGWSHLRSFLRRWKWGIVGVLGVILLGTFSLWEASRSSLTLDAGNQPTRSLFRGTVPEPRRADAENDHTLPNIILISLDTLRWDRVPPRNQHLNLPNLQKLRRDSMSFDRAYSTSSWTLPAHGSLFTGLLPVEHGGMTWNRIYPDRIFYTHLLQKLGYRTGAFTDGVPVSQRFGFGRGFDVFWEQPRPFPALRHANFTPGFLELSYSLLPSLHRGPPIEIRHRFTSPEPSTRQKLQYFSRNIRAAKAWVRQLEGQNPYFLFLHTLQVHDYQQGYPEALLKIWRKQPELRDPVRKLIARKGYTNLSQRLSTSEESGTKQHEIQPTSISQSRWSQIRNHPPRGMPTVLQKRYRRRLGDVSTRTKRIIKREFGRMGPKAIRSARRRLTLLSRQGWRRMNQTDTSGILDFINHQLGAPPRPERRAKASRLAYDRGIEAVDRALGSFLDWLERRGEYRDSLIILFSDHGEGFGLENTTIYGHDNGSLHETLTRVPLWIKWPDNRGGGRRIDGAIQLNDVFPILFNRLNIQPIHPNLSPSRTPSWEQTHGIELPRRPHVRTAIAGNVLSNYGRPTEERQTKLAVQGRRWKIIQRREESNVLLAKISPNHLEQKLVGSRSMNRRTLRYLRKTMHDYRKLQNQYPSPFMRQQNRSLDKKLRRRLKGLGYLKGTP